MMPLPSAAVIEDERLAALPGVRHGFFTRMGGVSDGIYASLNCGLGSNDDPRWVRENRARVAARMGVSPDRLDGVHQIHSADVVDAVAGRGQRPKADAIVSSTPGLAVGVLTADCGPILFADAKAGVVAAAHSGWGGSLKDIGSAVVAAMERHGARRNNIVAVLGPTISQPNYEVGPGFPDRFLADDPDAARFFEPGARGDHFQFDLPGFIIARLQRAGIDARWCGLCTYGDETRFFSYRRTTHRGEPDYGRQMSAIVLEG